MSILAVVLLGGSAIAFAFLAYSLLNLESLGIQPAHPRIVVEAVLGLAMLAAGLLLRR